MFEDERRTDECDFLNSPISILLVDFLWQD